MEYTKGVIAGGWIHVSHGKKPIALVHPQYVDKFIAAPELYEALKRAKLIITGGRDVIMSDDYKFIDKAIAKAGEK